MKVANYRTLASAQEFLNDAGRVRVLAVEDLYHSLVSQRKASRILRSIPDDMILNTAESEGLLA
jgi:hypothetical protein